MVTLNDEDVKYIVYLLKERARFSAPGTDEYKAYCYALRLICGYLSPSSYEAWMG